MADFEAPDADVVEQEQEVTNAAPHPKPVEPLRDDVPEADALEQAHPFPLDDEEQPR